MPPRSLKASEGFVRSTYATAIGISAALLFWIQPLVAKSLLPSVGGAPAVWHTVIVFFQTTLLLGYAYAHFLTKRCPPKAQAFGHLILLAIALPLLPNHRDAFLLSLDTSEPSTLPLHLWIKLLLLIGLPCFLLSSTSPLFQNWYSQAKFKDSADPYFLYTASNIGSLAALTSFPLILESRLDLSTQLRLWSFGFIAFVGLTYLCYRCQRNNRYYDASTAENISARPPTPSLAAQTLGHPKNWFGFAFLGSSLMLGATNFLTTEIMNAPLIGLLPLALFLGTFIIAFKRVPSPATKHAGRLTGIAMIAVLFQMFTNATDPAWLVTALHLFLVLTGCLFLHVRLAESRPAPNRLTEYYLWMSTGGVVAGLAHTFLSPLLFNQIWEYPLTLVGLAMILPSSAPCSRRTIRQAQTASIIALMLYLAFVSSRFIPFLETLDRSATLVIALVLAGTFITIKHPIYFAGTMACLFLLGTWRGDAHGKTLFIDRNFFGVSRVTLDPNQLTRRLVHGNTIHGRQFVDPRRQALPLSYYHPTGPLRRIMKQYEDIATRHRVAVIGLGAGSMLYYGQPHQSWTLFEIDPLVIKIAQTSRHFSYLENATVKQQTLLAGDARIKLQSAASGEFDLIVLDAFSSDSIPVHLFTHEAMGLYLSKLAETGLLAFHISNRTLDLAPILGRLASESELVTLAWKDDLEATKLGKDPSHWVALARNHNTLSKLSRDERWQALPTTPNTPLWTDERSNILDALP